MVLVVVIILVTLYLKAQTAKNLSFNLGLPKKFKSDGFAIAWEQPLEAQNGGFIGVNVSGCVAKLFSVNKVNNKDIDTEIGTITLIQPTKIEVNQVTPIPLKVRIPVLNFASIVGSTVEAIKNKVFKFKIKGFVSGESVQIPLEESFTYLIPSF